MNDIYAGLNPVHLYGYLVKAPLDQYDYLVDARQHMFDRVQRLLQVQHTLRFPSTRFTAARRSWRCFDRSANPSRVWITLSSDGSGSRSTGRGGD